MKDFIENIDIFKALGHPVRARIIELLSHGELNACMIIKKFNLSQSTISHHMRLLCESGIVSARSESQWIYYNLNKDSIQNVKRFFEELTSFKEPFSEISCKN